MQSTSQSTSPSTSSLTLPDPPPSHNLTLYSIGRGEHLVLTHEPYKSFILPHWRFRTRALAQTSAAAIYALFLRFHDETRDFVGMDMCRKFLQMGMTRAKRYANFKGGRKYDYAEDGAGRTQREKGREFEGREEKDRASEVFREAWDRARAHEGYQELKTEWMREKKAWIERGGKVGHGSVKLQDDGKEKNEKSRGGVKRKSKEVSPDPKNMERETKTMKRE